ncbi:MAG TPA: hypothetical protein VMV77_02280 [Bacteroidales bacterium]|nr:hypothetical protein [Bacteroidales bacterium]
MKFMICLMRVISFVLVTVIFGTAVGYGLDVDPWVSVGVIGVVSLIPSGILGESGVLGVLIGIHTGQVAYGGSIESPVARIMIDADSATALATVMAVKLTLNQATKRKTGNMIPEISFAVLADICGFIDAIFYEMTVEFRIIFSIPISLGGAYDLEGGSIGYVLSGCTAADTIKVYAIDDARRELDYLEIVPVSCPAGGVKVIDSVFGEFLFVDPTNLTRVKINYANGVGIEYLGEEVKEIARLVNPVHKVTNAGLLTAGYSDVSGINIRDAVTVDITLAALGLVYVVKHLLAG